MNIDYNELERRVFAKFGIDPDAPPENDQQRMIWTADIISIKNTIHVLAEYDKMKNEQAH
ncbi:MAG: hypothetical protein IJS96_08885 [Schwartzia sp.]|nr:hypothetical protein [Schwartzia sp. (in: firmicutes)]